MSESADLDSVKESGLPLVSLSEMTAKANK